MDNFSQPTVPQVSSEDVKRALDDKEKSIVLDVRTPGEFARGNIQGSINLPLDHIETEILKTIPDVSTKIYVYCLSGSRSVQAVEIMVNLGYTNVFDMAHGLLAWRVKGYPLGT